MTSPILRLKQLLEKILIVVWARFQDTKVAPGGPRDSRQPTDNVMRTMNLVMPLKNKTAIGRAEAALVVGSSLDEIYSGLDNVGTVHMARFTIVDNNLLMFSFYDGDFRAYIRDFIVRSGLNGPIATAEFHYRLGLDLRLAFPRSDQDALRLAETLKSGDELTSRLLPGFACVIDRFFEL